MQWKRFSLGVLWMAACGDSGVRDDSATGSAATSTVTDSTGASTLPTTTIGETDSEAGTATASATEVPTSSTTDDPGETGTTGLDMTCVDTPPPGFTGPTDPACAAAPQVGTFEPMLEWNRATWTTAPTSDQVLMSPIVASLDGDAVPDVAFVTYVAGNHYGPGVLRAMSGDGQQELLNVEGQDVCGHSGLAAGDIDGDGQVELVVVTIDGAIKVFEHDGAPKWTSEVYGLHCSTSPGIADFDGDGTPEVYAGAVILDADGNERGVGPHGNGFRISVAADIDEDGQQELVVGNAVYDGLGEPEWFNMEADGIPGVADFTGDSKPEIVVSASGTVRLQDNQGVVLWTAMVPGGGGGAPTIADYDGDGEPEVGVAGSEYYVVFDTDGTLMWQAPISETESATGSIVYDFEGDGIADVIHADENRVWVFSGLDGAVKLEFGGHGSATQLESPVVVDVDGDGQVEIVFGNNQYYDPAAPKGISVIGDAAMSWRPGRKIWNQFQYSITNVADDGTIPAMPAYNWTTHNNYRSGDDSPPDGLAAPDLVLEANICQYLCQDTDLQLWVNVGNAGASALTAGATIEVYGELDGQETLLASQPFLKVLPAGEYATAIGFDIDAAGYDALLVRAVAGEQECKLDNNVAALPTPFCNPPE
ncbi:FG-GAP-like repeat-containing protein [Nannocystis bainbridge]|uniref:FG-GAP-like repeat-containing protein n=1 Tax=Nannocystis bainbridge TaxID=2995303 RepID=A0ABT5DQ60_9BACT|nr:FG-GAP-like repeat-containing protein [Nannocystis bainbridge]MDC0715785.1 FG-GAP-like repeat-containing protein [Nannocystis bainbridge]